MANKLVTLRLGNKLLKEIDSALENSSFENRTDLIKHAVRSLLKEINEGAIDCSREKQDEKPGSNRLGVIVEEAMEELGYVR
ncbi:MAG: ribbon-helix-helix domain-containing protein [Candidatus ainarchaeum sp.]|nr:ribbon-helix-helix domain-containing protein [Candidatus ainarchaeum sp.]